MNVRGLFTVLLALIVLSACENLKNPNSPTSGFDPSKPVDTNNMPPGPGPGVRASVENEDWGIFLGNCPQNPGSCENQIRPTADPAFQLPPPPWAHIAHYTFLSGGYRRWYTMHLCVTHPKVLGRKLYVKVTGPSGEYTSSVFVDEGSIPSPYCVGVPYQMSHGDRLFGDATGGFEFSESNQDLLVPTEWKLSVGFKAVDSRLAGH